MKIFVECSHLQLECADTNFKGSRRRFYYPVDKLYYKNKKRLQTPYFSSERYIKMIEILAVIIVAVLGVAIFGIFTTGVAPTKLISGVLLGVFFILVLMNL